MAGYKLDNFNFDYEDTDFEAEELQKSEELKKLNQEIDDLFFGNPHDPDDPDGTEEDAEHDVSVEKGK